MQVVIEIPDNVYEMVMNTGTYGCYRFNSTKAIKKGIPLSKGHGDLIDRKELLKQPIDKANYPSNYVRIANTIIEADAESEDKQ